MSWLFVFIAVVLIGVLSYYLTLTTRPEISQITPEPNTEQDPGPVNIGVLVTSQERIEDVQFYIDGQKESPRVEQRSENEWWISYEDVFERGEREVAIRVTDASGRTADHSWQFVSSGELVPPRIALVTPPPDATLENGTAGVSIHATTFAEIDGAEVTVDGTPVSVEVTESESASSEYSMEDELSVHEWEISGIAEISGSRPRLQVTVTDAFGAEATRTWTLSASNSPDEIETYFVSETGQYVEEPIYSYWRENGGEETFGPPVSPLLRVEDGGEQQYFRFARIEVDAEGDIHLGLIGREAFGEPEDPPDRPPGEDARLFDPTGHFIHGTIKAFWADNGGLPIFGYPISQVFDTEDGYAQYFERALIEVTVSDGGEEVAELAPLGERLYDRLKQTRPQEAQPSPEADSSN